MYARARNKRQNAKKKSIDLKRFIFTRTAASHCRFGIRIGTNTLFGIYHQLTEGLQEIQMENFSACIAN